MLEIYNGTFSVYVHTNKINGKMYVGITGQNPEQRWQNGAGYKKCRRFENAIKKYGWDNFEHDIVASNLTLEEANNMEKMLIEKLDLQNPDVGYNLSGGGDTHLACDETKRILSEAHKGRRHTEEECANISKANKGKKKPDSWVKKRIGLKAGENHPLYGKSPSEETLKKRSDSLKKYYAEHSFPVKPVTKRVIQIETGKEFDSIELAAETCGICRSSISENCAGKRKSAGGFHWKFAS